METSGQLSKAYIQVPTDFEVQLELYINEPEYCYPRNES
jgi:hypothetical protein